MTFLAMVASYIMVMIPIF